MAKRPLHALGLPPPVRHGAVRAPARGRRGCRLAREQAHAGDDRRSRARGGSGRAPRPARPPGRSPRRHESLRASARVVARDRGGVCRVHPRAARRDPVRPDGDRLGRRRLGAGDRGCGCRGRKSLSSGHAAARDRLAAPGRDEARTGHLPRGHARPEVSRGGGIRRARPSLPPGGAAVRRAAERGHDLARPRAAELLHAGRDRVRLAARPLPRQHGAEHPRLRGRAARPSRSSAASRRSGRTSSRSSRTSCGARWRPSSGRPRPCSGAGAS